MPDADAPQTILAFDYGQKRIGIAAGQTVTGSANPLGVVANGPSGPDHERIAALLAEWRPDRLVVGMPAHADGRPSAMGDEVRGFIASLERYALPIETVDERHTSQEAEAALKLARRSGSRRRVRREHVDAAAAVMIAERYLKNAD